MIADSDGPRRLRDLAAHLAAAAAEMADFVDSADPSEVAGVIGALDDVLAGVSQAQSAAVGLVDRIQQRRIAPSRLGMTLERYLAGFSRATAYERRGYLQAAEGLRDMPHLKSAFRRGRVGYGEVRSVVAQVRSLDAEEKAKIDDAFQDEDWLASMPVDDLVDAIRHTAARHQQRKADERALRQIERRFLSVQPQLDGALTLYGELDAEAGSVLLSAMSAAMPRPTANADHSRGALDATNDSETDESGTNDLGADGDANGGANGGANGDVNENATGADAPGDYATRARQRADALVLLAEQFLSCAGHPDESGLAMSGASQDRNAERGEKTVRCGRPSRRRRPSVQIVVDVAALVGEDAPARLLWEAVGLKPMLTAKAARRLASDADLQFLLSDGGEVLGISRPTPSIPRRVRAAVHARDQGCRFPGCHVPVQWCDLHHVVAREKDGPTEVDNLVALCRRHHTAVTQSTWKLAMARDGTVTVKRGQRKATSTAPLAWDRWASPGADAPHSGASGPGRGS
ncbi:MAG: DUF222 domain-containing protein, partial [Nitriliruptoraceae bacterium]